MHFGVDRGEHHRATLKNAMNQKTSSFIMAADVLQEAKNTEERISTLLRIPVLWQSPG